MPKVRVELDKLSLTKKKMLNKVPGLDIDRELKKADVNFTLPSIKNVNPSFDFSGFQFKKIDDIFGTAMTSIEDAIIQGIEKGLVTAFKGILKGVLKSLNLDAPDLRAPDFGGLSINDIMDASAGFNSDLLADIVLPKINNSARNFDPNFHAYNHQFL